MNLAILLFEKTFNEIQWDDNEHAKQFPQRSDDSDHYFGGFVNAHTGQFVNAHTGSGNSHIETLIKNSSKFGLTQADLPQSVQDHMRSNTSTDDDMYYVENLDGTAEGEDLINKVLLRSPWIRVVLQTSEILALMGDPKNFEKLAKSGVAKQLVNKFNIPQVDLVDIIHTSEESLQGDQLRRWLK